MVAEERLHNRPLVGFEPLGELGVKRIAPLRRGQRTEGERGGTFHVARHQEPPRRKAGLPGLAAGGKVGGEGFGERLGGRFVELCGRVASGQRLQPFQRVGRAGRGFCGGEGLGAPCFEGLVEQGEVQQPLAGIVDDIQMQRRRAGQARQEPGRLIAEREADLADPPRAFRPDRLCARKRREMGFIIEARGFAVRMLAHGGGDQAPVRCGGKLRHPPARQQIGDQRGDEDGLACAAEAGDAEPQGRLEQHFGGAVARFFRKAEDVVCDIGDAQSGLPWQPILYGPGGRRREGEAGVGYGFGAWRPAPGGLDFET